MSVAELDSRVGVLEVSSGGDGLELLCDDLSEFAGPGRVVIPV